MLERLEKVFREVFDNDTLVVDRTVSNETLSDWDSFAQVKLVIALEEEFGVKFTTEEVLEAHSVADFEKILKSKGVSE